MHVSRVQWERLPSRQEPVSAVNAKQGAIRMCRAALAVLYVLQASFSSSRAPPIVLPVPLDHSRTVLVTLSALPVRRDQHRLRLAGLLVSRVLRPTNSVVRGILRARCVGLRLHSPLSQHVLPWINCPETLALSGSQCVVNMQTSVLVSGKPACKGTPWACTALSILSTNAT